MSSGRETTNEGEEQFMRRFLLEGLMLIAAFSARGSTVFPSDSPETQGLSPQVIYHNFDFYYLIGVDDVGRLLYGSIYHVDIVTAQQIPGIDYPSSSEGNSQSEPPSVNILNPLAPPSDSGIPPISPNVFPPQPPPMGFPPTLPTPPPVTGVPLSIPEPGTYPLTIFGLLAFAWQLRLRR